MKKISTTFKSMDKVLLTVTIVLFIFGLFNIVTASSQVSVLRYSLSLYNYFYKQLLVLIIGCVGAIIILKTPTKLYKIGIPVAFLIIAGCSILVSMRGETLSGNKNWLPLFGFMFQPSEFAKPIIIVYLSILFESFYTKLKNKNISHWDMIGRIAIVGCFFPIMVFFQHDLGTMLILAAIFGTMLLASPIMRMEKLKLIGVIGVVGLIGIIFMLVNAGGIINDTQASRFDFYDPCSKYESGGYQICNGFIAINAGGLLGVGIGESRQKSYIPESHTDSVFAIIAEEYGFIVTSIIMFAYVVVLYRILKLASVCSSIRGKYICYGVSIYIFLHILINLGGLFGSMPLTGVPLPFLSYGGSFTLSLVIALAIVQRVHIEYKNEKVKI